MTAEEKRLHRGPQGAQGERGQTGETGETGKTGPRGDGLPPAVRRAIAALFLLMFALGGLNLLFTAHYVNATRTAQQQQGQVFEHKICTTLVKLAREKPPPGDPATNPSRAYLQHQYATLAELSPDLGCAKGTP